MCDMAICDMAMCDSLFLRQRFKSTWQKFAARLTKDELLFSFLQDATAIKKTVVTKRLEIEHTLSGAKSSKRLRQVNS